MFNLDELIHVLLLRDYNTRLVVGSTVLLGAAAGVVGSFLLLRKRSLIGDALSHATLPGIALAFLVVAALGGSGKELPALLAGAALFGMLGVGCVLLIRGLTRLKDDAAMGIVLSVFFGIGVALLGVVQKSPQGQAAGLKSFIYGKTASMVWSDFLLISIAAGIVVAVALLLFKELKLLCFDDEYAAARGWPTLTLDLVMLSLVTGVTVIGLQSVGLILIIALLIIPAAAARFWTERFSLMIAIAALIGALSGWIGASASALLPDLPAGAVIVLVAAALFILSMLGGGERGVLPRAIQRWRLARSIRRQHLLRALYEVGEGRGNGDATIAELLRVRSWSPRSLEGAIRRARREGLLESTRKDALRLTAAGRATAAATVRNHRLWELYLITHADVAPSHVDRDADMIEHVLPPAMIQRLEALLRKEMQGAEVPESPHVIG